MSLTGATTQELLARLERKDVSAVEVAEDFLQLVERHNPQLNALLHVNRAEALRQAEAVDRKRSRGERLGKLAGIPVAIKDVICTIGQPTTCGSRMLENYLPPYDAHVIQRLRQEDAILIGKANMDEFAMGSSTENSAFGPTRNPWDVERTPGGSSGGSAAAVAANFAPLSLGSDTGGSIRQPAGFCGVVGMKPTYGRVSRYGVVAFASSLDQVGPFANDVHGAALLLEAIAGHDRRDSTSLDTPTPRYGCTVEEPLNGLKIGIVREHLGEGLDDEVRQATLTAIDVYRSLGAEVIEVSLPHSKYSVATYYLIAPSEASSNLARYDGVHYGYRAKNFSQKNMVEMYAASRGEAFGAEVKRRIMLGTYALSQGYYDAYYLKALKVRRLIRNDYDAVFSRVDVLAGPVTPTPAFKLGEMIDDPLAMYLSDIFTIGAPLAGIPAMSVPAGRTVGGLPIGLQLQAAPLQEEKLLRVARMFERETEWHKRRLKWTG